MAFIGKKQQPSGHEDLNKSQHRTEPGMGPAKLGKPPTCYLHLSVNPEVHKQIQTQTQYSSKSGNICLEKHSIRKNVPI